MKRLYNFYIEDEQMKEIDARLFAELGEQQKGLRSALIRVLFNEYLRSAPSQELSKKIIADYVENTLKNKRDWSRK